MNPNNNPENMEEFSEEIETDDMTSIDDFIKELEAREKDLHISNETVIEIEDSDFDDDAVADFILNDPANINFEKIAPVKSKPVEKEFVSIEPLATTEPKDTKEKSKVFELEHEVKRLNEKILKFEAERTELFDLSRRRQTDFDNFKKRTERDKSDTFSNQLGNLAIGILPVLDNLDRAMEAASKIVHEKSADFQQFFDGIALVNNQLNEVLAEMGVKSIDAIGEAFDPHFHEAVETEATDDFESNMVLDEMLRGYVLGEKVIRPSMVKVSKAVPIGHSQSESNQNVKP